jgi:hypothetical protein
LVPTYQLPLLLFAGSPHDQEKKIRQKKTLIIKFNMKNMQNKQNKKILGVLSSKL